MKTETLQKFFKVIPALNWISNALAIICVPLTIYSDIVHPEHVALNLFATAAWTGILCMRFGEWIAGRQNRRLVDMVDSYSRLVGVMIPVMKAQTETLKSAKNSLIDMQAEILERTYEKDSFDLH